MGKELAGIFSISWTLFVLSLAGIAASLFISLIPDAVYFALVYLFLGIGLPFFLYPPFRFFTRSRIPPLTAWHAVTINTCLAFLLVLLSADWQIQSELWSNPVYEQVLAIGFGDLIAAIFGVFGADLIRNAVLKKYPAF